MPVAGDPVGLGPGQHRRGDVYTDHCCHLFGEEQGQEARAGGHVQHPVARLGANKGHKLPPCLFGGDDRAMGIGVGLSGERLAYLIFLLCHGVRFTLRSELEAGTGRQ